MEWGVLSKMVIVAVLVVRWDKVYVHLMYFVAWGRIQFPRGGRCVQSFVIVYFQKVIMDDDGRGMRGQVVRGVWNWRRMSWLLWSSSAKAPL